MYSGDAAAAATDYAYMKVFDTSAHPPAIDANTTLSYWIYPQNSISSTCVAPATRPGCPAGSVPELWQQPAWRVGRRVNGLRRVAQICPRD